MTCWHWLALAIVAVTGRDDDGEDPIATLRYDFRWRSWNDNDWGRGRRGHRRHEAHWGVLGATFRLWVGIASTPTPELIFAVDPSEVLVGLDWIEDHGYLTNGAVASMTEGDR